jgi:NodT family efflux transporter outer membrane factor (OMF) lipoprotein
MAKMLSNRNSGMIKALLIGQCLTITSGCTSLRQWADNGFRVGPNYCQPEADVAQTWIDYADPRTDDAEHDLSQWWRVFNDPTLDELIESTYQQNLSLRVAGARILEARARRRIAAGNLWPQFQEAFGDYSRNKISSEIASAPPELWFSNWETGFNLAWELDFWGRYRRAIESSDALLDASIENYDDVLVILLADVATNYVQYRTFQERLTYARENVVIQTKSLQLAQDKFTAGAATERDVQQARQVLEQTQALIPELEIGVRRANNALCVLLGMSPRDLATILGRTGAVPSTPRNAADGIPADLVRRRPDLRRAEREVAAQSALIGVAEADFYPRLSLIGTLGVSAEQFGDMFDTPGAMSAGIAPEFRWDVLNYGRIFNNVQVQDARFQQLAFAYQEAVLRAGREAEDAMITYVKSQEQTDRLAASVDAALRTYQITFDQYSLGAVDFTPVFLFQTTLTEQQDQLAISKGNVALGLIDLYRSLGGGWEMRLGRGPTSGDGVFRPLPPLGPAEQDAPVPPLQPAPEPDAPKLPEPAPAPTRAFPDPNA